MEMFKQYLQVYGMYENIERHLYFGSTYIGLV